ncbi:MAG TPA: AAA family ATPase [Acidobacteriaceae bacterium]|nr:AAA family ATPase [Acidobacteriaceae bacterium]
MRRRKKPVTNNSESTGKIGHEIPQNQPSPLQPSYPAPSEREEQAQEPSRAGSLSDVSLSSETAEGARQPEPSHPANFDSPRHGGWTDSASKTGDSSAMQGREYDQDPEREHDPELRQISDQEQVSALEAGGESGPVLVHETQPESLATPPAALQVAPAKGYVVLTIGLPGSGKTTWFKRRGVTPLSSDMLRSILFDDITEQRYQGLVFSTLRSLLRARLIAKMPWNYVDATNLSPHERRQWIKMARSFGYEVQAVFFDVPFEVCMQRNLRRDRMLNEETMAKMQERLRPPSFKEGFHKITVVRVKNSPTETPTEAFDPPQS